MKTGLLLLSRMAALVSNTFSKLSNLLIKVIGINLLTKEQTEVFLRNDLIGTQSGNRLELPPVVNLARDQEYLFEASTASAPDSLVWQLKQSDKSMYTLMRSGRIRDERRILTTDYWDNRGLWQDIMHPVRSPVLSTAILLAPWSHYVDGIMFGGYYDFVLLVAAKISRIKQSVPATIFKNIIVSYPLFNAPYEAEILSMLGFGSEQVIDSRSINVSFKLCLTGNSGDWFYPNAQDILTFKAEIERFLQPKRSRISRIYVCRAGRRQIINEPELITMLVQHGFDIIEDVPRSVAEQVAIYKDASIIIGPHGASFTNCIWCDPGAHLIELFSANYRPNFFQYLTAVMGMSYSAYCHGKPGKNSLGKVDEDIWVSVPDLEKHLIKLLCTE